MKDKKTKQIEVTPKAPDSIRQGVQSTLNSYRLMGDIASLYLHDLSQTLIGFTSLMAPKSRSIDITPPPEKDTI